ncbi:hypothetical protein [Streptomyces sp. S.PB5]|uniref:hypothetical protein n=1 Tax=Streptomyces sp. S.PB5 TaxID=3020844 RepID=UPI0025B04286|nr:hypothetical protein [Streptomyces sp. S.PB5]MDN3028814.1 hypothetical protein [Streptomyces sp. S.PB5]
MMYNLLVTGAATPSKLPAALATAFHISVHDVDVADALGDPDRRNWDAAVSCAYTALHGDLSWALDLYAQESVPNPPGESDLAKELAALTGEVALLSAAEALPSAYWAASPNGLLTRARVFVSDDEEPVYRVDAVEMPLPGLPGAHVTRIAEVVGELNIPTPLTDTFRARLPAQESAAGTPGWEAWTRLGAWEKLVAYMASGWSGSGWCPPDLYRARLEARDALEDVPPRLPEAIAADLMSALQHLDNSYAELTAEDKGGELAGLLLGPEARQRQLAWWWHRRPEPLPW